MRVSSSKTAIFVVLLGCFLCSVSDVWFVSAYSQHRPTKTTTTKKTAAELQGRRELLAGMVGILSLAGLPHEAATASESVLSGKYCAYGEGTDCEALAEGNPYILELQRKSAANKQANIASAKNAFYAKNYPDWFAAVGKTMVQKESDATFVVIDNSELAKLWDEGKVKLSTPMTLGGKIKDVTQKPMLILKDSDSTVMLQDDSTNDMVLQDDSTNRNSSIMSPWSVGRKAIRSAAAIATAVLLGMGMSSPAFANADHHMLDLSMSAPSSSSSMVMSSRQPPPAMEISDLTKSLQPATESRPQIPFPTNEALQRAAEQAASASSTASRSIPNPFSTQPPRPIPQENLLRENQYSLPALINLESARNRPYNGADILVLQVWTDRPVSTSTTPNEGLLPKTIGGAKIPISAVKGGFPVRVSLGPQNALSSANANPGANDETSLQEWKDYLSSQSLWVRAAICREGSDSSSSSSTGTSSSSSDAACPSNYPTPLLEGIGFSKWIDLSTIERAVTSKDAGGTSSLPQTASSSSGGLRAPVSLVLSVPQ